MGETSDESEDPFGEWSINKQSGNVSSQQTGDGAHSQRQKRNTHGYKKSKKAEHATKIEDKAKLEEKVRERVACEARAFDVVNCLIESAVSPDYLQQACQFIDHNHYQDVVEERAISKLCGYPLCGEQLGQITKSRYHISTKTNTVYDITERKNFCSNGCYQASKHLLRQIPQTPVWTRRDSVVFSIDLIQHHDARPMVGEEVIGSSLFPLKRELLLLETIDRFSCIDPNANSNNNNNALVSAAANRITKRQESPVDIVKHDVPVENYLTSKMVALSLQKEQATVKMKEVKELRGDGLCQSLSVLSLDGSSKFTTSDSLDQEKLKDLSLESKYDSSVCKPVYDESTEQRLQDKTEEIAAKSLAAQVSMQKQSAAADSDDESTDNSETIVKSMETNKAVQLKAAVHDLVPNGSSPSHVSCRIKTKTIRTLDSDDDDDSIQDADSCLTCKEEFSDGTGIGKTIQNKLEPKTETHSIKESHKGTKSHNCTDAYLMSLLDRRRDLLARVADIQKVPDVTNLDTACERAAQTINRGSPVHHHSPLTDSKSDDSQAGTSKMRADSADQYRTRAITADTEKLSQDEDVKLSQDVDVQPVVDSMSSTRPLTPSANSSRDESKKIIPKRKPGSKDKSTPSLSHKTSGPGMNPLVVACQFFSQWVTGDTLRFLGVGQAGQGDKSHNVITSDPKMEEKYQTLCQRLANQEMDFGKLLGEEDVIQENTPATMRPLPHIEELKKQTAEFQLKVAHFLHGTAGIKNVEPRHLPDKRPDNDSSQSVTDVMDQQIIVLPAVDSHNQLLIRRRIMLERIDRAMSSLLMVLGISVQDIATALRELVFTFSLNSNNIVLKPTEWTLVAMILIIVLREKCPSVNQVLKTSRRTAALDGILGHLGHSATSLCELVTRTLAQCRDQLPSKTD